MVEETAKMTWEERKRSARERESLEGSRPAKAPNEPLSWASSDPARHDARGHVVPARARARRPGTTQNLR